MAHGVRHRANGRSQKKENGGTKMKIRHIFVIVAAFAMLFAGGCSKTEPGDGSEVEEEKSPIVADVGESAIRAADLKDYLAKRPVRHQSRDIEGEIKKRLDEMILEEVLYQEALRLELDQDPEMRRNIRQMLTQKLMSKQMNAAVKDRKIDDQAIQEYYDQQKDEFNRPAQVRLADIFISVPADATAEKKEELRKKAEKALEEAVALKGRRSGFGTLIRKYSDTNDKYRKGDTGFFDREAKPIGIDKSLVDAAFGLERVGNMVEQVIETPEGFHIVMLTGKRSAINRPLEKVRNQIVQRIRRENIKNERETFIQGLKKKADISIDDNVLAEMADEMAKPRKKPAPMKKNATPGTLEGPQRPPAFPGE